MPFSLIYRLIPFYSGFVWILCLIAIMFPSLLTAQPPVSSTIQENIDLGLEYADQKNDYAAAVPYLLEALKIEKSKGSPSDSIIANINNLLYHTYGRNGQYAEALPVAFQLREWLTKNDEQYNRKLVDNAYDIAFIYDNLGILDSAEMYYLGSIKGYLDLDGDSTADLALAYHNLSSLYRQLSRYDEALSYAHRSLGLWGCLVEETDSYTIASYGLIASIYGAQGLPIKSIEYRQKALALNEQVGPVNYSQYAGLASSFGSLEYGTAKSIEYYQKSLEMIEIQGGSDQDKANILSSLGERCRETKDYSNALLYHSQSLEVLNHSSRKWSPVSYIDKQIKIGRVYREEGEHEIARNWFRIGLNTALNFKSPLYSSFACYQMFLSFGKTQEFDSAFFYMENGLSVIMENDFSLSATSYRHEVLPEKILPNSNYLTFLLERSLLFWNYYQNVSQHPNDLDLTQQGLDACLILASKIEARGGNSKAFNATYSRIIEAYIHVLKVRYQLSNQPEYLQQAFTFAEQTKSRSLILNLQQIHAQKFAGIPDSVLALETQIKSQLTQVNQQIYVTRRKGNQADSTRLKTLYEQLFDLGREFEEYVSMLDTEFPSYHTLKYQQQTVTVAEVQSRILDNQTAIIEYFWGESTLFIFTIQKHSFTLDTVAFSADLPDQIMELRRQINQPYANYQNLSYEIFQSIFSPAYDKLSAKINRLIIIPDAQISLIPFEVLLTKEEDSKNPLNHSFLINRFTINYGFSATILLQQLQVKKTTPGKKIAIFAPSYGSPNFTLNDTLNDQLLAERVRDGLIPLPGAKKEAELIQDLLGGEIFSDHEASEARFKEVAEDYLVLHLAMHTMIEEENPMYSRLLFTQNANSEDDNYLYAGELYNLNLKSDLAVLSACNTGYGRFVRNEGLMSLSRAFAYAGCPSIITSLWKVPDKETQSIMVGFYEYLQQGKRKDEALREAKVAYLNQLKVPELAHPFYWAGFISVGSHLPLSGSNSNTPLIWGIGIFVALGLIGFWFRWKKRR